MPAMIKILTNTTFAAIFVAVLVLVPAKAEAQELNTREEIITSILEEIDRLLGLVKQREDFLLDEQPEMEVEEEILADFFARLDEENDTTIYNKNKTNLLIETDGGVSQLLLVVDCSDYDGSLRLFSNSECSELNWLSSYEEINGVKTFKLPVSYISDEEKETLELDIFACRFNGCHFEKDISFKYKDEKTFADDVKIYDRYEWIYEWNDRIHHVQEVLLDFPYRDVKSIKLRVRCSETGLYITTNEDNRTTCNSRRRYSQPDYRDYETDEQGNTFNLRVESVTNNIQDDKVGSVELEFVFYGYNNRVLYTAYHTPLQRDVELTLGDEEEE